MIVLIASGIPSFFYTIDRIRQFFSQFPLYISISFLGDNIFYKALSRFEIIPEFFTFEFLGTILENRGSYNGA